MNSLYKSQDQNLRGSNNQPIFNKSPISPHNRLHSTNNVNQYQYDQQTEGRTIVDDLQGITNQGVAYNNAKYQNDLSQDGSIFEHINKNDESNISLFNGDEQQVRESRKVEWEKNLQTSKSKTNRFEIRPEYDSKNRLDTDIENPTDTFLKNIRGNMQLNDNSMERYNNEQQMNTSSEVPVNAFIQNLKYGQLKNQSDIQLSTFKKPLQKKIPKTTRSDQVVYDTLLRSKNIFNPPPEQPRLNSNNLQLNQQPLHFRTPQIKGDLQIPPSNYKVFDDPQSYSQLSKHLPDTSFQVTKTITESRDDSYPLDASLFQYERANPFMEELYHRDTYVLKKKANYIERLSCSIIPEDNVFKIYDWDEKLVQKGIRLIKFKQTAPDCVKFLCCSHYRSYRTLGKSSNRTRHLTKSIRTFRWMCPCNHRKPINAVFDVLSGYLGKIELVSSMECIFFCKTVNIKIYDHRDRYIYKLQFPALNMVSVFGLFPWERHDRYDFRVINKVTGETASIIRKQWSYFCKDKCSNGGHYFIKFRQNPIPWNHKQLIFEALMMVDMSHYNLRCVQGMEMCALFVFIFLAGIILIFYGIFMNSTF